jgi:hypothetical protein
MLGAVFMRLSCFTIGVWACTDPSYQAMGSPL